ncbi:MAG TPA: diaminopimelate epimerase [Nocardioidaceae bacterium]|nr:diaminopimelate epimerase [Nocardioidaceae bacterium]
MAHTGTFPFVKGHGTENDFVILPDPDGSVHGDLAPELVAALCDRRAGIGGDGVMRAIRTEEYDDPAAVKARGSAEWFMDYRNSDGSYSEMCGNGARVFARYLADHEGVDVSRPLAIGTRAGVKTVMFVTDEQITVDMGEPTLLEPTSVSVGDQSWPAANVDMGNPHAVACVDSLADAGPLLKSPIYDPGMYPDGVNIEFVVGRGERHVAMRVYERGSGETRSCGTGACAVMVASALADGSGRGTTYRVDVPGGVLTVTWTEDNRVMLTGPAVLVATGEVSKSFAAGT